MSETGPGGALPEGAGREGAPVDLGIAGCVEAAEIGRGGFGIVYRASQPRFGRVVAVKVLAGAHVDDQARIRFERELEATGRLSGHPHIVTVYEAGFTTGGRAYIVMGYEANGSLGDRLRTTGRLAWNDAVSVAVKIAGALEAAHRMQILHRDVKPENILLSAYWQPKLADFGVARIVGGEHTRTGVVTASIAYAAPEILDGARPSVQSDVYSLAATLAALILGRPPFAGPDGEGVTPLIARIARDPAPDLRAFGVPAPVAAEVERAMAKASEHRPQTALEFGQALQRAQVSSGMPATELVVLDASGGAAATVTALPAPGIPVAPVPYRYAGPEEPTALVGAELGSAAVGARPASAGNPIVGEAPPGALVFAAPPIAPGRATGGRRPPRALVAGAIAAAVVIAGVGAILKGRSSSTPPSSFASSSLSSQSSVDESTSSTSTEPTPTPTPTPTAAPTPTARPTAFAGTAAKLDAISIVPPPGWTHGGVVTLTNGSRYIEWTSPPNSQGGHDVLFVQHLGSGFGTTLSSATSQLMHNLSAFTYPVTTVPGSIRFAFVNGADTEEWEADQACNPSPCFPIVYYDAVLEHGGSIYDIEDRATPSGSPFRFPNDEMPALLASVAWAG